MSPPAVNVLRQQCSFGDPSEIQEGGVMEHIAFIWDAAALEAAQGMPMVMNQILVTHLPRLAFYTDLWDMRYIITETLCLSPLFLLRMLVPVPYSRTSLRGRALFLFVVTHILLFVIQSWQSDITHNRSHYTENSFVNVKFAFSGADAKSGSIFCNECEDFVYDTTVSDVYASTRLALEEKYTTFQGTTSHPSSMRIFVLKISPQSQRKVVSIIGHGVRAIRTR